MKTMLMTAVRKRGAPEFEIKIHGYPGSEFPPISLQGTLREVAAWLRHLPLQRGCKPAHRDTPSG